MYEDQPGPNCRSTKVGYEVTLLLPFKFPTSDDEQYQYPWSLTRPYFIVTSGNANDMVLVPIATAFQLLGLIIHILSSCTKGLVIGWVSERLLLLKVWSEHDAHEQIALGCTALGMLLAWASFGVTYRFTDTVKENLRSYNDDVLAVINPLVAHRGNAVWFLAAAAVSARLCLSILGRADADTGSPDCRTAGHALDAIREATSFAGAVVGNTRKYKEALNTGRGDGDVVVWISLSMPHT